MRSVFAIPQATAAYATFVLIRCPSRQRPVRLVQCAAAAGRTLRFYVSSRNPRSGCLQALSPGWSALMGAMPFPVDGESIRSCGRNPGAWRMESTSRHRVAALRPLAAKRRRFIRPPAGLDRHGCRTGPLCLFRETHLHGNDPITEVVRIDAIPSPRRSRPAHTLARGR